VVNACVVRQSAEDRAVSKVRLAQKLKLGKPELKIILTGCMVSEDSILSLKVKFPYVDLFLKPQDWEGLRQWMSSEGLKLKEASLSSSVSSSLPIISGCNNFCSYCIVPYRRGREKSVPPEEVLTQAKALVDKGAKEIVLLGQNVNSYGHDLDPPTDLAYLLERLSEVNGLLRIRFLTNHPKDVSPHLVKAVVTLPKVCEYLSLPFQSGDDGILKLMHRGYTREQYLALVENVRRTIPDISLSTDVIVGFPGEDETRFSRTLDLMKEVRFDTVHVASYSPRPGTWSARNLKDDVKEKEGRRREVEKVQRGIQEDINSSLRGKKVEILVEGKKEKNWWGRTRGGKLTFFPSDEDEEGKLVEVKIREASPWFLQGEKC
jgi:tRNA-2-methylthio-N6-dimethylallyladenosine synthase